MAKYLVSACRIHLMPSGQGFKQLMATFESARILNFFKAAEIQAQVIARGC
ncbi:MAG: hypothetical protein AB7I59_27835 [Geminicoccaceae bacterium]